MDKTMEKDMEQVMKKAEVLIEALSAYTEIQPQRSLW